MIDDFPFGEDGQDEGQQPEGIAFFECSNDASENVDGVATRAVFTGYFSIDGYMLQRKDGSLVSAGLGADFDEAGGPVASWAWFSRPANQVVKERFEEFFDGTFSEDGLRMDMPAEAFLKFADSSAWDAYAPDERGGEDDEDDEPLLFG